MDGKSEDKSIGCVQELKDTAIPRLSSGSDFTSGCIPDRLPDSDGWLFPNMLIGTAQQ